MYSLKQEILSVHDIANLFLRGGLSPNGGINVQYATWPALDAFGRLRVSQPLALFANKQLFDKQSLFWDDAQTTGTATTSTYNNYRASTSVAVGASTFGKRVRQTKQRFNYQSGKSQLGVFTAVLKPDSNTNGISREVGLFDDHNGLFFRYKDGVMSVVKRSRVTGIPVDTAVAQSAWNVDKLDGNGPSGKTLDVTKAQIMVIDFQWLGVGTVRFGFEMDGELVVVHMMHHSNIITSVYMSTPNLPVRYSITNDGTGGAASLEHICSAVMSEAGVQDIGIPFSADRGTSGLTTLNNASIYPLVGIRLKSTHVGADIKFKRLSLMCDSTSAYRWCLLLNPTVVGTALTFSDLTNSATQTMVNATNGTTLTGGTVLDSGYGQQNGNGNVELALNTEFRLGVSLADVFDTIYLGISRLSVTAETFYGSMGWQEMV